MSLHTDNRGGGSDRDSDLQSIRILTNQLELLTEYARSVEHARSILDPHTAQQFPLLDYSHTFALANAQAAVGRVQAELASAWARFRHRHLGQAIATT
ncbi:hypothetical protein AC578_9867 [Pseudocercospora eumusae]|uniref:Uncharacterized protein n=1 Tax=Pseudocercospora eumusae TaxID=321146 RepID=A0A139HB59_9PEZI|nr:hypothetical protein AC578_9867 [Pseudocercospora eumusae]